MPPTLDTRRTQTDDASATEKGASNDGSAAEGDDDADGTHDGYTALACLEEQRVAVAVCWMSQPIHSFGVHW